MRARRLRVVVGALLPALSLSCASTTPPPAGPRSISTNGDRRLKRSPLPGPNARLRARKLHRLRI